MDRIPSSEREGAWHHIVTVRCCREWPVVAGWPVRRCGLCGEKPTG